MEKIITCMAIAIMAGCGYMEPGVHQPHGILHPLGNLKILEIDEENVVTFAGDYVLRVAPGSHFLTLNYGSNRNTPVEGTKSYLAYMRMDVIEGMRYYLATEYYYSSADVWIGKLKVVRSWKPVVKKEEPIEGYAQPHPPDTSNNATDQ